MHSRVEVEQGWLEGLAKEGIFRFLGVPYAAPPVGNLRWRAPRPPPHWEGVRSAKAFGPNAVQTAGASFSLREPTQSEDCLYLNIWTARLDQNAKQPVMVWIHGGGNFGGAGSEDAFDGASLATRGSVVVTFNYRLGAFGFIAHPRLGANFAVLDHVALLRWVATNIGHFGGDPANITIFGESAGAVAVRTLLQCPAARGLFHQAILQSAGFERFSFAPAWSYDRASAVAEQLFDQLGSRDTEVLRQVPTEEVKRVSHELSGVLPRPGHVSTSADLVWMPVPDGEIVASEGFPGWPEEVPLLLGCVENEARYFVKPGGTYTWEQVRVTVDALCKARSDDVLTALARTTSTPYEALDKLLSTAIWFEPALAMAKRLTSMGRTFFYYHFARTSPGARRNQDLARHTAEVRYVFGNLTNDGHYDETDHRISAGLQKAWIEFARTGVPHGPEGTTWPAYTASRLLHMRVEETFEIRPLEISGLTAIIHSLRENAG